MQRSYFAALLVGLLLVGLLPSGASSQVLPPKEPVDYVDPLIGTLGSGFVFPGPDAPFGMVQLSPDTDFYFAYTGYMYNDANITGFSHVHLAGMGVHSGGNLPFMPTVGPIATTDARLYKSAFDHASEDASPGYYRALLERYGVDAELTAGTRVGMHRYTFPPGTQSNVILDVGRSVKGFNDHPEGTNYHQSSIDIVDDQTVVGTADSEQDYTVHFAAKFDRPFASFGTWDRGAGAPVPNDPSAAGDGAGGAVTFDTTSDRDVLVKVGISYVSRENALANLEAEKPDWDFNALRQKTRGEWNDALETIDVTGNDLDKTRFYTALYHVQQHPNIYQDVNGEYMGHDNQVHRSNHDHYANFSLWDTYRGQNSVLATIQPARYRDMVRSLLDMYNEAGRLPKWALNDAMPDYMNGDPVQQTVADAFCRGVLTGVDRELLYEALRHNAFDVRQDWAPGYLSRGWVARADEPGGGASGSLEFAIADFALALIADELGHHADRDALLARAASYSNLIDPGSGFARPRNADGTWKEPYLPEHFEDWKEGTGWQYTWLAPHDLRGLYDLIGAGGRGGDATVKERLDTFFSFVPNDVAGPAVAEVESRITLFGLGYFGNQYAPSNEHDLHAPYLYNYIGEPWKTQAINRSYQSLFRPTPDGLPGNDDLGSMSGWFVWSALGIYPMTHGSPVYAIGSPLFERAVIDPVGEDFTIEIAAPGASAIGKYVQSAGLGTTELDQPWVTHGQLLRAGKLELQMGPVADKAWGSSAAAAPPSMSTHDIDAFGCDARPIQAQLAGKP
jgi:predicted alpha-1,2-mannosidase